MTTAPASLTVPEITPGALLEIAYFSFGYTTREVIRVTGTPVGPSLGTSGNTWIAVAPLFGGKVTGARLQWTREGAWELYTSFGKRLDYVIAAAPDAVEGRIPEARQVRRYAA
jgi:hypothetical protein